MAPNRPQTSIRLDVSIGSIATEMDCQHHVRYCPDSDRNCGHRVMSQTCQQVTHAPQQLPWPYSTVYSTVSQEYVRFGALVERTRSWVI
jgi:hypothetical protein